MTEVQIKQTIGQLEASIDKIEAFVNREQFEIYCDNIYGLIAQWRVILKKVRSKADDEVNQVEEVLESSMNFTCSLGDECLCCSITMPDCKYSKKNKIR